MKIIERKFLQIEARSSPLVAVMMVTVLLFSCWSTALAKPTNPAEAPESIPGTILLSAFYAFPQDAWMQINWETALEMNIQGFNLYRRANPEEDWDKVNDQLIVAVNLGGFGTENYTWLDSAVQPGIFYEYLLEVVDSSGKAHWYGPSGDSPVRLVYTQLFLPVIQH
jgi:hypothetical protein